VRVDRLKPIFKVVGLVAISLTLTSCGSSGSAVSNNGQSAIPTDAQYQVAWKQGISFGKTLGDIDGTLLASNNPQVVSKFSISGGSTMMMELSFGFTVDNPNPCGKGGQAAYPDSDQLTIAFEGGCWVGLGYPLKQHT